MQPFVIVNPNAGSGRAGRKWPQVKDLLRETIGEYQHALTTGPADATDLARNAIADGATLVIAVGGDGTVNEVINGFQTPAGEVSARAALAVVPLGTGSDFGKTFDFPGDLRSCIARIGKCNEMRIDLGTAEFTSHSGERVSRLFANIASFGLSGAISKNIAGSTRFQQLPGKLKYLLETLSALSSYQPENLRIEVDNTLVEDRVTFAAIANGKFFGGGMKVAPDADVQDGQFEVIVLEAMPKLELAGKIPRVYRGTHIHLPQVKCFKGSKVRVSVAGESQPSPVYLDLDGECPGRLDCEFCILPQALRLIV